LPDATPEPPFC
jgi:hypothetical protein